MINDLFVWIIQNFEHGKHDYLSYFYNIYKKMMIIYHTFI